MASMKEYKNLKIAFVSPLPPSEFGVPIYSAKTIEALSHYADVDVVSKKEIPFEWLRYVNNEIDGSKPRSLDEYDACFFVYGNHSHHMDALRFAYHTKKGVGIFHDAQLFDFARQVLGDTKMIELASKRLGRAVGMREFQSWHDDRSLLPIPFLEPASTFPHAAIVHSPTQREYHAQYSGCPTHYVPVAIQHVFQKKQLATEYLIRSKIRCGLDELAINIGTFGFVHFEKLPDIYLATTRHLHDWGIPVHFWFVGTIGEADQQRIVETAGILGLESYVHFSGRVSESKYCDYLLALDMAIQIRRPYFGQLSGALLDCVSAGLPTVANTSLAESIEAPSYVKRIKDHFTSINIAEACTEV